MRMKPCWLLVSAIASADAFSLQFASRSNIVMQSAKRLDDGEATRDAQPESATRDSNDPINEVEPGEKFAEYMAKRRGAAATPASAPSAPQSVPAEPAKPRPTVSTAQGFVLSGGTLGIIGAAFCTSTGSPPTGLAVAVSALAFMAIGATIIESAPKGSDAQTVAVPAEGAKPLATVSPVQAAMVVSGILGILGAAYYTTTTDAGGVLFDKIQSIPASMTEAWRSVM